jgi:hypothetical protein
MSFMDYYDGRERERAEEADNSDEDGSGEDDIDTLEELLEEDD